MKLAADRVLTPEEAVEHYGPLVLRTAFGLVKNMQDAEDIAQEVFLTLLKKDPAFDGPAVSSDTDSSLHSFSLICVSLGKWHPEHSNTPRRSAINRSFIVLLFYIYCFNRKSM